MRYGDGWWQERAGTYIRAEMRVRRYETYWKYKLAGEVLGGWHGRCASEKGGNG